MIICQGVPLVCSLLVLGLDLSLPEDYDDLRPNLGHSSCFIEVQLQPTYISIILPSPVQEEGLKRLVYFHGPVMVMMVTNLALYVVTVFHLNKHHQQTRAVRQSRR